MLTQRTFLLSYPIQKGYADSAFRDACRTSSGVWLTRLLVTLVQEVEGGGGGGALYINHKLFHAEPIHSNIF